MEKIILKAKIREITGKKVKKLRESGEIPVVLYGKGFNNLNLTLSKKEFEKVLEKAGTSTIVSVEVDGKGTYEVLLHEPQRDSVKDQILHVDLYKVNMKEEIHTEIPLEFVGTSAAVEDLEGSLITSKDSLEVKCLPGNLVSEIKVDISFLKTFEDLIKLSDLQIPEGIEVLSDPEEIIAQVTPPRSEEELEEMEQEAAVDQEKAGIESIEATAEKEKSDKEAAGAEGEETGGATGEKTEAKNE